MRNGWSRRPEWSPDPREDWNEDPPEWVQVSQDADGDPVFTVELPDGVPAPPGAYRSSPGSHCNSRCYWIWPLMTVLAAACVAVGLLLVVAQV